ncbi:hypothetical protein ACFO6U_12750 [Enterococcus canintestini]
MLIFVAATVALLNPVFLTVVSHILTHIVTIAGQLPPLYLVFLKFSPAV